MKKFELLNITEKLSGIHTMLDRKFETEETRAVLKMKILCSIFLILFLIAASAFAIQSSRIDKKNEMLNEKDEQLADKDAIINDLESEIDQLKKEQTLKVERQTVHIMHELLAVSDLATYSYEYTNAVTEKTTRVWPGIGLEVWGSENSVTLEYSGVINVGFDMNKIQYELSEKEKTIYVKLPSPEVLDNYIKFDDLVCTYKNNILNPLQPDSLLGYFDDLEKKELVRAEADDIYAKATAQVKQIITGYFSVMPDYQIVFR